MQKKKKIKKKIYKKYKISMQNGGWRQRGRSPRHWAKETAKLAFIIKVKNVKPAIIIKV